VVGLPISTAKEKGRFRAPLFAGRGYFAAAMLLPLYYLADASITLIRRFMNGESVHAGAPKPFLSAGPGWRI
jgi:hypothetical protein